MNELSEMIADLPRACDVGTKRDSQGHQHSWVGYKLHWDVADGGIPIAAILTSASVHDSQAFIPLAKMSAERVTSVVRRFVMHLLLPLHGGLGAGDLSEDVVGRCGPNEVGRLLNIVCG
jgi:hypothetical protein